MDNKNRPVTESDVLLDHNYDGIQEYDNPLPNWWLTTLFTTLIFGFIYWVHYSIAGGPTLNDELKVAMTEHKKIVGSQPEQTESESELLALVAGAEKLTAGQSVYEAKCSACHAGDGGGLVGPNLTDKFWIHGSGDMVSLVTVIRKGVPDKGMPAWETMISKDEVLAVTAYVHSLKGKTPAAPKAAQGQEFP